MSDEAARQRLLARIGDINDFDRPRPLVSLEEFFVGNDDEGSIGYNLTEEFGGPQGLFEAYRRIRDRPDVADVIVEVKDLEDEDGWPSSDTVLVITAVGADEVYQWLPSNIAPDEWGVDTEIGVGTEPYPIPDGLHAVFLFYD